MRRARVLIVDDEADNREILGRSLALREHSWEGAGSAEEAEAALDSGVFDFVLLDHILPGRTGMQALRELKKRTAAPIWVMSGQSDDGTRDDALALGADGFLPKPLDIVQVLEALAALPERAA